MKKTSLCFVICLLYLSCKKEEIVIVNPAVSQASIQLKIDRVITDSTIVLKWSKFTGNNFQKYRLVRNATFFKNGEFGSFSESIDSSNDVNHLSFSETNMPLARNIYYDLFVSTDTAQFNNGFQWVARVFYERPNSLFYGIPKDVLIDKKQQKIYITDLNEVTVVNYVNGRILYSKKFPAGIGFCSLGDFNGITELYAPLNDGWVEILDASTLILKDRIYVGGYGIGSVVAANAKLYVSSSDMTQGSYSNCIKVYDRATKKVIARTGYLDRTRLLQLEGSSVELIDLSINQIPVDLSYYQFSPTGELIVAKQDAYHGDYSMDCNIVRSFPGGDKFITSSDGTIFNKSLDFDRHVKRYGNFSDFAFNSDGTNIYTAYGFEKKIDAISYPTMTNIRTYSTILYPYKIFRDGNIIICVSRTNINQQMTYLFTEKIDL